MNTLTDQQLLADYAARRSESAFAELVRRHVDFVYSTALRMARDCHLAEDVTQGVFVALAKSAGSLAGRPVIAGWLHRTTQNLTANAIRAEVRRRAREQEAVAMNEPSESEAAMLWDKVSPELDAALGDLSEADRDAVLLRYFERKSAREMAQAFGTSEEAAQKRVHRAVERLRGFLLRRGVAVGASGLAAALSIQSAQAAPALLATSVTAAAVAQGAGTAASTSTVLQGSLKLMAMAKTKAALVAGVALLVVGSATPMLVNKARIWNASAIYEQILANPDSRSMGLLESAPPTLILRPTRYPESGGGVWSPGGKGVYVNSPLADLIGIAHGFAPTRIIAPSDMPAGSFDYLATLPHGQNEALLAEIRRQFSLVGRRETRPVEALMLEVKDAAKLERYVSKGGQSACFIMEKDGVQTWTVTNSEFSQVARNLEGYFQKPVLDETDIQETYDFEVVFPKAEGAELQAVRRQKILEQLEAMGLALVARRQPIEMLVVSRTAE